MKGIFRNKEVCRSAYFFAAVSAAFIITSFMLNYRFGLVSAIFCLLLWMIHFISVIRRYKRISELSAEIDHILHGEEHPVMKDNSEGELAILESEISKMVIRLREQQERMKSEKIELADSLADISHQIRTPLTSINLIVTMLGGSDVTPEKRRELLHKLKKMLSRIDWLITALLKMSKLEAGTVKLKSETVPMKQFLEQACMPLQIPIEIHGQALDISADGEFTGDISWTGEAVGNIVKNCMEHTPDGGKISVNGTDNAIFTEIVITDSGCGISEDDLPHIFERFYKGTVSDDKGGFGIGLALARMIVTGQNGTIKAENSPDGGARFILRFYKCTV